MRYLSRDRLSVHLLKKVNNVQEIILDCVRPAGADLLRKFRSANCCSTQVAVQVHWNIFLKRMAKISTQGAILFVLGLHPESWIFWCLRDDGLNLKDQGFCRFDLDVFLAFTDTAA